MTADDTTLAKLTQSIVGSHHLLAGNTQASVELQYIVESQQLQGYGLEYYPAKVSIVIDTSRDRTLVNGDGDLWRSCVNKVSSNSLWIFMAFTPGGNQMVRLAYKLITTAVIATTETLKYMNLIEERNDKW